jgi:hypothetical protein
MCSIFKEGAKRKIEGNRRIHPRKKLPIILFTMPEAERPMHFLALHNEN